MNRQTKIFIMLYLLMASLIAWLYCKVEEKTDSTELIELKTRVSDLISSDSLNTIRLHTKIMAYDSVINTLKERDKANEIRIDRLKKSITFYDYTSNELPEL